PRQVCPPYQQCLHDHTRQFGAVKEVSNCQLRCVLISVNPIENLWAFLKKIYDVDPELLSDDSCETKERLISWPFGNHLGGKRAAQDWSGDCLCRNFS